MSSCNTTCPYCGVGCGVTAELDRGQLISVEGDSSHPANAGQLCVKGTALAQTLTGRGRLLYPSCRGLQTEWDDALELVAQRIASTRERYGPEALGFYLSGQLLTEDYYVANKLMKGFLGSANVDTNSRLCMSSAVAGYQRAFGADFVPCSYRDLETCDLLVMVGSNAAWTHPVIYQRIARARKENPCKRIVVIDPRRTDTCDIADLHLQITPGSDGFLFAGLLSYLRAAGLINTDYTDAFTSGLEESLAAVVGLDLDRVAASTGIAQEQLAQFYRLFADTDKTVTLYSQGINQSATGTDKCNAIINCHLATGRLGRPGTGPFSITGQPNAMGGREVGGLAHQLAAHMDFSADNVNRVERFWEAPAIAREPGLKAVDMFRAAAEGKIRFLWIMATNPAVSLPDSALVRRALERCDFVVLSDCVVDTDTAAFADVLLPAMGWGEKDGTVTNSERCISRQRKLVEPQGEARPDWWIVSQVARRLGFAEAFDYGHPAQIFSEHAQLSAFENEGSRDFDIGGLADLGADAYEQLQPTYWPRPATGSTAEPLSDGRFFTASGRAQFIPVTAALPDSEAQSPARLALNTGRLRDQWHTMTRTGLVPQLMRHRDFYSLSLSPVDAQHHGLEEGDLVEVRNELGSVRGLAHLDEGVEPGQVFSPIHWSDQFSGKACVSALIPALTDPVSGQPQSKFARVSLSPVAVPLWGLLITREPPILPPLGYWSRATIPNAYLTILAADESMQPQQLREVLLRTLQSERLGRTSYQDPASQDFRDVGMDGGHLSYALYLHKDRNKLPARDWLSSLPGIAPTLNPARLLAGLDPGAPEKGRLICTCLEVGECEIQRAITAGASSVEHMGETLRCGTQCGSCLPELRRLLHAAQRSNAA